MAYHRPRPPRLLVAGNYGFGNLGDEAILGGIVATFQDLRPDVRIVAVSGDPAETEAMHRIAAVPWDDVGALAEAADSATAVVLGGGGLLHDYSGFDASSIASEDQGHLARYFRAVALATAVGKPLGLLALGVGPLRSESSRLHTRLALEQAWLSTVRDTTSHCVVRELGVEAEVAVVPDPAFALASPAPCAIEAARRRLLAAGGSPVVAVAVRPWPFGPPEEQLLDATAACLDEFVGMHGGSATFLPFQVKTDGDRETSEAVRARMQHTDQVQLLDDVRTPEDLLAHVAAADVVIAMRLHALVFAAHTAVPAIGISYDPKVRATLADMGHARHVVELGDLDRGSLSVALMELWSERDDVRAALLSGQSRRADHARQGVVRFAGLLAGDQDAPPTLRAEPIQALATQVASRGWGAGPSTGYDVVCFSIIDWEFRRQRPQQLMSLWGRRGRRVFYVRVSGFLPPGARPVELTRVSTNVWAVRIAAPQPFDPRGGDLPPGLLDVGIDALQTLRDRFEITSAASVVHAVGWAPLALASRDRFGWDVLYDCMDDWGVFPQGVDRQPLLAEREAELIDAADVVAVTSEPLRARWSDRRPDALVVPNAADFEFFQSAASDDPLADVEGQIAGFVGAIAEWFDVRLVAAVARACPDVTFVLVGGVHRIAVDDLEQLPNVRLVGAQPYDTIPGYIRRFDACLVPFVVNRLTHSVDPVKVHEYLSLGKPVVATRIEAITEYAHLLYVAADGEDFVVQLRHALSEDDPVRRQRRIDCARANSWAARLDQFEEAIAAARHQREVDGGSRSGRRAIMGLIRASERWLRRQPSL